MKENYRYKELNFTPSENRVIIKIKKFVTFKQSQRIVDQVASAGLDPMKDDMVTKIEEVDIPYAYQIVEIVGVSDKENYYIVGDKVVLDFRNAKKMDLYKDMYWVWRSDIHGVVQGGTNIKKV
jgi:hypothetical protein